VAWRLLDDRAFADAAFRAEASTMDGLFVCAAEALLGVMTAQPGSVQCREERPVRLESPSLEMLLFDLLQEIVFLKDSEGLLLKARAVSIEAEGAAGPFTLAAVLCGEKMDPARHSMLADVKAVTLHRFSVEQVSRGWAAEVVLDV
jgi:SHS2 domain-containing protein